MWVRSIRLVCFFFNQKTAYDMRISDWSSDVCSSDLVALPGTGMAVRLRAGLRFSGGGLLRQAGEQRVRPGGRQQGQQPHGGIEPAREDDEIGRASCRERGWQYV